MSLAFQGGKSMRHVPILEENDDVDLPALFHPRSSSMRFIGPWGNFVSYQVNVDDQEQNIVGDAANEPSLCVDPTNPNRIAVGWRQFDSVTSNFRQGGYGYSADGGLTWHFPGVLESGVFRSDPVLVSRYDGKFFYLSLLETFYDTMYGSLDGGGSWGQIAPADGGDKQWFTVDNSNSVGRGNLYQSWSTAGNNYNGRQFTRSTDGGSTWMTPVNIPQSPVWGTLDVDNAGTLYLGGWGRNGFVVCRSTNAKNASTTPSFGLNTVINLGGSIDSGSFVNPGGLTGQMWVAVDHSSAASPQPVYALCSVAVDSNNPGDVMLARSVDGNVSWSTPVRVNDDPLNAGNYHWFGTLAVGPTGRLDVVWNDTRDDPSHNTSALYYAYSLDGGQHFSTNIRVSQSWNQSIGYPDQNKMGDYIGVVSNSVGANIAYTATFNNEEDIYFLQIPSPVVVAPSSFSIAGAPYAGSVNSLAAVDGGYLTTKAHGSASLSPTVLTVQATSPSFNPKAVYFNLVSHGDLVNLPIHIAFYNWQTSSYETLKNAATTTSDSWVNLAASGDLTRFVQGGTGTMRARVTFDRGPNFLTDVSNCYIDQAAWNVIP
ncbi:MAG TPA: sialidase family protein [Fimbriimonadaceae bacterium]|nr:sialidase family protein [Fimbriimonadaceae bacterium]